MLVRNATRQPSPPLERRAGSEPSPAQRCSLVSFLLLWLLNSWLAVCPAFGRGADHPHPQATFKVISSNLVFCIFITVWPLVDFFLSV